MREEFAKAAEKLPDHEQDEFARWLLAKIEADERDWDADAFARSADKLERLADEAIAEHRAGRTRPFDPNKP